MNKTKQYKTKTDKNSFSLKIDIFSGVEATSLMTNKQRVGSFRSRLKKQQPIMMSEPPLGTVSPGTTSEALNTLVSMASQSVDHPHVAVTVHQIIDSKQDLCDL